MVQAVDAEFPGLFCHRARLDWGVGVLAGERDGKRRYLFEGGEERTMAAAHDHLMQKVEHPDRDQQATYARLMALLAKREGREPAAGAEGAKALMLAQLEKFRRKYPGGFSGDAWKNEQRNLAVRRAREGSDAQALSAKSLEALARSNRLEGVWDQVVKLVGESGLGAGELETTSISHQQRALGASVRELLHGSDDYAKRFDAFVTNYQAVFQKPPSWQAATALPALLWPVEHVCVDPTAFRSQLKAFSRQSTLGARPSGAAYLRCRSMARALASALAADGEVPADLLEVYAFIRATLGPARRAAP